MSEIGRYLIVVGLLLAFVGVVVWGLGRAGFHGLPGDVFIMGKRVQFYFPVVTSLVISVILTALLWLWQWMRHR